MKQRRGRWVTVRGEDGGIFRGKGKDVIRVDVLKKMRDAAKRNEIASPVTTEEEGES